EIEDDQMQILGLHTVINDLPDARYTSLKLFMCVVLYVDAANLVMMFGLTLIGNEGGSRLNLAHRVLKS
ncbi:hypothetical protein BCV71DRAFT_168375, partial [Rhizopus microsporus]